MVTCVRVIQVLAIITIPCIIALDLVVNVFLSYRLDPAAYFKDYINSTVEYNHTLTGTYNSCFWTHKITTILWACFATIHICTITAFGKIPFGLHEIAGIIVLGSANVAATSGLNMLVEHQIRYDSFTRYFVGFLAIGTYIITGLWFLAFLFKPVLYTRWNSMRIVFHHSKFGFIFVVPPLGMMLQFLLYSLLLLCHRDDLSPEREYRLWRISMYICIVVGAAMGVAFFVNYFYVTRKKVECGKNPNDACSMWQRKDGVKICCCMKIYPPRTVPDDGIGSS